MMTARAHRKFSAEEYLLIERPSVTRSEFFRGDIYAMSGASRNHNRITVNLASEVRMRLKGRKCEAFSQDLRVAAQDAYFYPDLVAVCEKPQFADQNFDSLLNPTVVIEVASPSTESFDRGNKFLLYQEIASLREFVLVAQDTVRVEHYSRCDDGTWSFRKITDVDSELELPGLGISIPVAEIYDRVEFGAP